MFPTFQAVRDLWKPASVFATKYRVHLGLFSTTHLAFIIWQTLSGAKDTLFESKVGRKGLQLLVQALP